MLRPGDRWGPFASGLAPTERDARLRVLRLAVRLICGERDNGVAEALGAISARLRAQDEGLAGIEALERLMAHAVDAIHRLAPLDRKRILSSYAGSERLHTQPIRLQG